MCEFVLEGGQALLLIRYAQLLLLTHGLQVLNAIVEFREPLVGLAFLRTQLLRGGRQRGELDLNFPFPL